MYLKKSVFICFFSGMLALSMHAEKKPAVSTLSFRSTSLMLQSPVPSGSTTYRATPFVYRTTPRPMTPAMRMVSTSSHFGGAATAYLGGTTSGGYTPDGSNGPNRRGARRGLIWDEELEEWVDDGAGPSVGDRQFINGQWMEWNGSEWVPDESIIPTEFTPVGDMPWVLMLCAALIYMLVVKYKKNRYEI